MADVLEEAAVALNLFTVDKIYHILSLAFLSEIATGKIAGSKLATKSKAELATKTFYWLRAIHDGKLVDFEQRGFAALMELHRADFITKARQNNAA